MFCHRCKHQASIQAGKYMGVSWGRTPCARCPVVADRTRFEALVSDGELDNGVLDDRPSVPDQVEPEVQEDLVARLVPLLSRFLSLDIKTRDVICLRVAGVRYREIARRLRISVAAVEKRQQRAIRQWPELRELFAAKTARRSRYRGRKTGGGMAKMGGIRSILTGSGG